MKLLYYLLMVSDSHFAEFHDTSMRKFHEIVKAYRYSYYFVRKMVDNILHFCQKSVIWYTWHHTNIDTWIWLQTYCEDNWVPPAPLDSWKIKFYKSDDLNKRQLSMPVIKCSATQICYFRKQEQIVMSRFAEIKKGILGKDISECI